MLRDRVQLGLCLLPSYAGFEKRVTFYPTRAAIFHFVSGRVERLLHRRRHPKVERIANECAVKFFRRDANDGMLNAVHVLRLADDFRIIFVTVLPGQVTNYRYLGRILAVSFFCSESAAYFR